MKLYKSRQGNGPWPSFRRRGMRWVMPASLRIAAAAALALGLILSIVFWWDAYSDEPGPPIIRTSETTLFTATNTAGLQYNVHLKPNILYDQTVLDSGQTYFSKLVDYMDVAAAYQFAADGPAEIQGSYSATAFLEGENIPQKKFPILLGTPKGTLSFDHSAKLTYLVYLKPNSLFNTPTLGPGEVYFANIVDHIAVVGSYQLQAITPSQSTGTLEITARLRAEGYWEKSQTILPETSFDASGTSTSQVRRFDINLDAYQDFADAVNNELGISPRRVELRIEFTVDYHGRTAEGDSHDILTPTLVIPLNSSMFTISGEPIKENSGIIEAGPPGAYETEFTASGTEAAYVHNFKLNLSPYVDMLATIEDQTGVTIKNPQLRLVFDVNVAVTSEHGALADRLSPTLVIPLNVGTFEVQGTPKQTSSKPIRQVNTITLPPPPDRGSGGQLASLIVFAILLAAFVALTGNAPKPALDPIEKRAASLRKRYGDRMVDALPHSPPIGETLMSVGSIEDLEKLADQLGKLIIHQPPSPGSPDHVYYVLDGSIRYEYSLSLKPKT